MSVSDRWSEADARAAVARYGAQGVSEPLALRTYSARLLGADPALVLHGGGNTSVKTTVRGLLGEPIPVLCVKGSGWDLATIEPAGHPAVRLEPLQALRALDRLSDEAMVAAQRSNLLDPAAPTPSVEALLHAFLPHTYLDHTHAIALLAVADQADAERRCRDLYGDRVVVVPYVMPGFALARAAVEAYEAMVARGCEPEGMVLLRHGLFSFGATAEQSYRRMIALVQEAERHGATSPPLPALALPVAPGRRPLPAAASAVLPRLRGAVARAATAQEMAAGEVACRWLLELRSSPLALALVNDPRLPAWAGRGVATPDHVIRTKAAPLVLPADADSGAMDRALADYIDAYQRYFSRQNERVGGGRRPLDPLPRLVAMPGLGLIGLGASAAAAAITADIGEAWAATLLAAEAIGRFEPVGENDTFDMEYWSLEQAKLGGQTRRPLAAQVVVVTGGGGGIGAATAAAFAAQGAELAVLDRDGAAAAAIAARCGPRALGLAVDVTDGGQVRRAFDQVCAHFGGLDIVVSNAGAAWSGPIASLPDADLRACFELNFFAHQSVAQAAVAVFAAQAPLGGQLLFNVSKQALNPGADFGAYGTSKAALLALMRQYALEQGPAGIRVNAINADRIRTGLLNDTMIRERSRARGLSEKAYMAGNLLGEEVRAVDVADAFVALALMQRTTGAVLTVDGGNVAAMVR